MPQGKFPSSTGKRNCAARLTSLLAPGMAGTSQEVSDMAHRDQFCPRIEGIVQYWSWPLWSINPAQRSEETSIKGKYFSLYSHVYCNVLWIFAGKSWQGSGTLSIPMCPYQRYIVGMWNQCPHPNTAMQNRKYFSSCAIGLMHNPYKTSQLVSQFLYSEVWEHYCDLSSTERRTKILSLSKTFCLILTYRVWYKMLR